ncbi:hypothetical protein [Catellatospora coxensis]|uniref:Uncharacterized protein n=1 Tax=Catellatospora coxensis TaxID=310354 RepID=A0A8J3L172_9ACTN|nr:hypothetical protein [Catellatospora coxensis]GIG07164.1 hypothetical protein Cco03nite_38640 [Catellatospora coxensis]
MTIWDELTVEQLAVVHTTIDEAELCHVIGEWDLRANRLPSGAGHHPSTLTHEERCALIPRFASVVADMVERGLVEVREPYYDQGWHDGDPMTPAAISALHDPHAWTRHEDGTHRTIWLTVTDHWLTLAHPA